MLILKSDILTFPTTFKVFTQVSKSLYHKLWKLIKQTDNLSYSFGNFNSPKRLYKCLVVVLYNRNKPIGFATVSFNTALNLKTNTLFTDSYLDIWIMPEYRCLGFGSLLMKRAVEECIKLTGKKPKGSNKHHSAAWGKRVKERLVRIERMANYPEQSEYRRCYNKILRLHQNYMRELHGLLYVK